LPASDSIGYDAWVVKIDEFDQDVELADEVQFGTVAYDVPTALVVDSAKVYVVGTITDNNDVLSEFLLIHLLIFYLFFCLIFVCWG